MGVEADRVKAGCAGAFDDWADPKRAPTSLVGLPKSRETSSFCGDPKSEETSDAGASDGGCAWVDHASDDSGSPRRESPCDLDRGGSDPGRRDASPEEGATDPKIEEPSEP
jgi:hypothetical protein